MSAHVLLSSVVLLAAAEMSEPPESETPLFQAQPVADSVEQIFADKAFSFCHDEHYPLSDREVRWCAHLKGAGSRCPAIPKACARGARATERDRPRPLPDFDMPDLPDVARLSLWAAIGLALGLVLWLVMRKVSRWKGAPPAVSPTEAAASIALHTPDAAVETDVQRLLARAEEAARAGALSAAVAFAHAALLRRLEGQGLVRVHASRTTSDYLRELARAAPEHRPMIAEILNAVDRAQYAAARPTPAFVETLIGRIVKANSTIRPLTLLLLIAWSACGLAACNLERRENWERSPSGVEGVIRLLQKTGLDARERLTALSKLSDETGQIILLPNATLSEEDWEGLRGWVAEGGRLVLAPGPTDLPKWLPLRFESVAPVGLRNIFKPDALPDAAELRWARDWRDIYGSLDVAVPVERVIETPQAAGGAGSGDPDEAAALSGVSVMLKHQGRAYAVEAEIDEGTVVAFADRNLFTNASLLVADNARFLRSLLEGFDGRVEVAGDLAGLISPNPVASVGRGRMAPFMIQVGIFLLALFFARGTLFGRPRTVTRSQRRRFVEHVIAVGLQLRRVHAARHALSLLGTNIVERLRRRARLTGPRGVGALAETLARQEARPVGEMARLIVAAREESPLSTSNRKEAREELQDQAQAVATLSQFLAAAERAPELSRGTSQTRATRTAVASSTQTKARVTTSRSAS